MRADRLLSIMLLLQTYGHMTAGALAQRLEVSQRTIYRDMDALSIAGVPVVAERGAGGGWFLLDSYEANLKGMNEAEIQTLFLSMPERLLDDLGLQQASKTALNKLLATLPHNHREDAEYIRQRIHIDMGGLHYTDEDITFLPMLQEAVWQERKVAMTYHLSTGPVIDALVGPLGLVASGSLWYLVATFGHEIGVYRVSRVLEARMTEQPSERPGGFDLATFWEASSAAFVANRYRYTAIIRADPTIIPRIRRANACHALPPTEMPDPTGWIQLSLKFESEAEACHYLLSLGPQLEVVEPYSLRERLIEQAQQVIAMYTQQQQSLLAYS